jgi:uncharacterized damage-inducible protein DinB
MGLAWTSRIGPVARAVLGRQHARSSLPVAPPRDRSSMSTTALLATVYDHKAWADDELLTRLQDLHAPDQAADRHTAVRLLNHIHVVDRLFEAQLLRQPLPYSATNTADTPTLEALHAAMRDTDRWYRDYIDTLSTADLGERLDITFTDGQPGCMSREEMLMHVALHGSYHRGAVGRILAQQGIAPPRDLLTGFLHQAQPERRQHGGPGRA